QEALARGNMDPAEITRLVMGWTVPERESFYGAPTLAARLGAAGLCGAMLPQACATGVDCLEAADDAGALEPHAVVLAVPPAPPPASHALSDAGLDISQIHVIKTHNPFAVNALWFAREMGVGAEPMNPYGSSLVYGHPQAPTGTRAIGELIEILRLRGGGFGLFTGCAAGDTGAAAVLQVDP